MNVVLVLTACVSDQVEKVKPFAVKYGINHVTGLIEQLKAQLVLIAHDVDPIEIVLWLPTLCKKMGVPFAIVKNKARLGALVHQKTATCVAITRVRQEVGLCMPAVLCGV